MTKDLKNLDSRIETKIAVGKVMNSKYSSQTKIYAQINSQLNILKY